MRVINKVLIIAAHPDDEVLGCGGLISKFKKLNVEFKVLFIAEGSSCRFEKIEGSEVQEAIKVRSKAAKEAMSFLGIKDYEFFDFPCGRLDQIPIIEINKIIEKTISEFNPDTIFTHSYLDCNNDHKIVYNSTLISSRPTPKNKILRLYSYEVLSSSEWNFGDQFQPNFFVTLNNEDLQMKIDSLKIYSLEIGKYPFPRSEQGVKTLAMFRGMQAGVNYAEAFKLIREIN